MNEKYFIYQKSTQALVFDITPVTLEEGVEVENNFDFAGYDFIFLLKKNKTDADDDAVISKTVSIEPPDETGGTSKATINLTPADTDIPVGIYQVCTRYHFDTENSYEGQGYVLEVRRAGTGLPLA